MALRLITCRRAGKAGRLPQDPRPGGKGGPSAAAVPAPEVEPESKPGLTRGIERRIEVGQKGSVRTAQAASCKALQEGSASKAGWMTFQTSTVRRASWPSAAALACAASAADRGDVTWCASPVI